MKRTLEDSDESCDSDNNSNESMSKRSRIEEEFVEEEHVVEEEFVEEVDVVPDWKKYEFMSCERHRKEYNNHTVYEWENVPEELLRKMNYITDYNQHRLRRLNNYKKGENSFCDYGLDGVAIDTNGVYHGLQMKLHKDAVTANKVGTFLSVMYQRIFPNSNESRGYLYYSNKIQDDLRDDCLNNNRIIPIEYNPDLSNVVMEDPDEFVMVDRKDESTVELRDYQLEAVRAIHEYDWSECNFGVLSMPCGCGKTVVCGKYMQECGADVIIFVAPLIELTDQNTKRLRNFVRNYSVLQVHSGAGGTTDLQRIQEFMNNNERVFIGVTYDSFELIDQILQQETLEDDEDDDDNPVERRIVIIVDEAHNIISENATLRTSLEKYEEIILVTATPPTQFEEFTNEIYMYTLGEAIKNKYVTDYQLYLPRIEMAHTEEQPEELIEFKDHPLCAKALFLINNMLRKGSKRCVTFMSSIEECRVFEELIQKVASDYHGVDLFTGIVVSDTKKRERRRILREFEKDSDSQTKKLYVIMSIRILDEGIDLPKCDSVFMANVTQNSSLIRLVQRMCRSNRLDSSNVNKKSNVFIWYEEEFGKIVYLLDELHDTDPEYLKKITTTSMVYSEEETEEQEVERREIEAGDLQRYSDVYAYTLEELAMRHAQAVVAFHDEHGRFPSKESDDPEEKREGAWLSNYKRSVNGKNFRVKNYEIVNKYLRDRCPQIFETRETKTMKIAHEIVDFYLKSAKVPSRFSKDPKEKKYGIFVNRYKNGNKEKAILYENVVQLFDINMIWRIKHDKELIALKNAEEVLEFLKKYKRFPSSIGKCDHERHIGRWLVKYRAKYNGSKIEAALYDSVNNFLNENIPDWFKKRVRPLENKSYEKNLLIAIERSKFAVYFFVKNGKFPSSKSSDDEERKNGIWLCKYRQTVNGTNKSRTKMYESVTSYLDTHVPTWRGVE